MKSRTKQSLMKRVNNQGSFPTTCKPSDTGTSYQLLHRTIWQHLSIVLFLLLSMGATAQAQTRVYVTNNSNSSNSNTVSVIDTATNTVIATIPVGVASNGPFWVAITPDGTRAYVTDVNSNTVSVTVIDTATNTVVATIPVGVGTLQVAITPDGTRAYVTDESSNTVSVIDTATNTAVATIPVGVVANGPNPFGVAITPAPQAPTSIKQCVHGGYLKFGPPAGPFKNQGQCVSYVEHH